MTVAELLTASRDQMIGQRFGRLVIVERSESRCRQSRWRCRCDCGTDTIAMTANLRSGRTQSCGCLNRERAKKHGMYGTPEYHAWADMNRRCANPNSANYRNYGGRGISVCGRWRDSFKAFFEDIGARPTSKHSLDRFPDQNGNYEPGNTRWATAVEQNRNKRTNRFIEYNGERLTLAEWAGRLGIRTGSLRGRISCGWPLADALTRPARMERP